MAEIIELDRALRDEPEKAEGGWRSLTDRLRIPDIDPEVFRSQVEKSLAPVETRDAVLALLGESRRQARWGRWMFWLAAVTFVLTLVNVAVFLAR
jgi:hypothetical protein